MIVVAGLSSSAAMWPISDRAAGRETTGDASNQAGRVGQRDRAIIFDGRHGRRQRTKKTGNVDRGLIAGSRSEGR